MKVVGTRVCVGRAFEGMREGGSSRARGGKRGAVRERERACVRHVKGLGPLKLVHSPGRGGIAIPVLQIANAIS